MTIELSLLLSGISVAFAIYFGIANIRRNEKNDMQENAEERAATNTMMMTKLENIEESIKDTKSDYKEMCSEVRETRDRVIVVEQSLKSYHKRLDGINTNQ